MREAGKPIGAVAHGVAWPEHVRDILAGEAGSSSAVIYLMAADVQFAPEVVELPDCQGKIPSVELELRVRCEPTRGLVKHLVRVTTENINGKVRLSKRGAGKNQSYPGEAEKREADKRKTDKIFHVPHCPSAQSAQMGWNNVQR